MSSRSVGYNLRVHAWRVMQSILCRKCCLYIEFGRLDVDKPCLLHRKCSLCKLGVYVSTLPSSITGREGINTTTWIEARWPCCEGAELWAPLSCLHHSTSTKSQYVSPSAHQRRPGLKRGSGHVTMLPSQSPCQQCHVVNFSCQNCCILETW